jgi:CRP/FNR family transcriptional regulator, cyclic AMP receptor protein
MTINRRALFDPKSFLAKVGEGRSIGTYHKNQIVFSQGDPVDAVFYIQKDTMRIRGSRVWLLRFRARGSKGSHHGK